MSKASALRSLLRRRERTLFMEAHNGISAKIVDESGLDAIWASGFTISASMGLADRSIASWSQITDVIECMGASTGKPILVDGDTGHGNVNNVQHLVRKLANRGAAGICIEDKIFPKANSFSAAIHNLASIRESVGRIAAAREALPEELFVVVARTEALIAEQGMDEALSRARAYAKAGADAIFIHSKRTDASEIFEFSSRWEQDCPLIIAPTTYPEIDLDVALSRGITNIIWANQAFRAAIASMRDVTRYIARHGGVKGFEPLCGVGDVLALTGDHILQAVEDRYETLGLNTKRAKGFL